VTQGKTTGAQKINWASMNMTTAISAANASMLYHKEPILKTMARVDQLQDMVTNKTFAFWRDRRSA